MNESMHRGFWRVPVDQPLWTPQPWRRLRARRTRTRSSVDRSAMDAAYEPGSLDMIDIGGHVGALVVLVPPSMAGGVLEICPIGPRRAAVHRPRVAVVTRRTGTRTIHIAVFPALDEGSYELYRIPNGRTRLHVDVVGGKIGEVRWPLTTGS
jgi:hypothetical protein